MQPGGSIRVFVSADRPYSASIVRLDRPERDAVDIRAIGDFAGRTQTTHPGSYVRVPDHDALKGWSGVTIEVKMFATMPTLSRQGIVTKWRQGRGLASGWGLFLEDGGRLTLRLADGTGRDEKITAPSALRPARWYHVVAGFSGATREAYLRAVSLTGAGNDEVIFEVSDRLDLPSVGRNDAPILIGAGKESHGDQGRIRVTGCYNGRLDSPQ